MRSPLTASSRRFDLVTHARVLVHAGLEHREGAEVQAGFVHLGLESEAADIERVVQIRSLTRGPLHEVQAHGVMLGADTRPDFPQPGNRP